MCQEEARQQYCDLIGSLVEAEGGSSAQVAAQPAGSEITFKTLLVTTEDNITTIKLNRPDKKNAITTDVRVHEFLFICQHFVITTFDEVCLTLFSSLSDVQ